MLIHKSILNVSFPFSWPLRPEKDAILLEYFSWSPLTDRNHCFSLSHFKVDLKCQKLILTSLTFRLWWTITTAWYLREIVAFTSRVLVNSTSASQYPPPFFFAVLLSSTTMAKSWSFPSSSTAGWPLRRICYTSLLHTKRKTIWRLSNAFFFIIIFGTGRKNKKITCPSCVHFGWKEREVWEKEYKRD